MPYGAIENFTFKPFKPCEVKPARSELVDALLDALVELENRLPDDSQLVKDLKAVLAREDAEKGL